MIIVESKRKKPATILKKYPDAILADVAALTAFLTALTTTSCMGHGPLFF